MTDPIADLIGDYRAFTALQRVPWDLRLRDYTRPAPSA